MSMWDDCRWEYDGYDEPDLDPDYDRSWWNKQGRKVEYCEMDNGYLINVKNMFNKKGKPLPIMLMVELRLRQISYK